MKIDFNEVIENYSLINSSVDLSQILEIFSFISPLENIEKAIQEYPSYWHVPVKII